MNWKKNFRTNSRASWAARMADGPRLVRVSILTPRCIRRFFAIVLFGVAGALDVSAQIADDEFAQRFVGIGEKSNGATIVEVSQQLITPVVNKALVAVQGLAIEEVEEKIKQELEKELEEELQDKLKGILGGKDG